MNDERRRQTVKALALLSEARGILEEVLSDEQVAFDNMPESFQQGERGEAMQEAIAKLEEAISFCENAEGELDL